jgi:hypothetical protein
MKRALKVCPDSNESEIQNWSASERLAWTLWHRPGAVFRLFHSGGLPIRRCWRSGWATAFGDHKPGDWPFFEFVLFWVLTVLRDPRQFRVTR